MANFGMNSPLDWMEKERRKSELLQQVKNRVLTSEERQALIDSAGRLGIDPSDFATAMAKETGGTFSTSIRGGSGNRHIGLIQFGNPEQKTYGAYPGQPFGDQVGAAERYLKDRGLQPGMGLADIYSTINAGRPGRYRASDRPGWTVSRHVADMEKNWRPIAERALVGKDQSRLFGYDRIPPTEPELAPSPGPQGPMIENWVRPGPEPQPLPQTDFYEPPEANTAEAPPYTTDRPPRVRPPESSLKFQDRPGEVQSKPPGVGEWFDKVTGRGGGGGLLEQFTTNKTDKGPPSQIAQGVGNVLGLGGDAVQKGAGLFGKLLSGISLLSSMQAPPPPPPQQEPSPDFAAAYQQQRRQAEEEPPPEPPLPQAQAVMTPQQIAEIKRRRQRLGLADLLV